MASKRRRKVIEGAIRDRKRKDRLARARRLRMEEQEVREFDRQAQEAEGHAQQAEMQNRGLP